MDFGNYGSSSFSAPGVAGCVGPTTQSPNVVQDTGLSATGNAPQGGPMPAPPACGQCQHDVLNDG